MDEERRDDPGRALAADRLAALLDRAHRAFTVHRDEIDALNVFPVPDGDTGTNLTLTARAAVDAVRQNHDDTASAVTRGALMGARGNSGVIFSQILRAFAEAAGDRRPDPREVYASALQRARELAYEAVAHPVEGTMLTAVRVAAEVAAQRAQGSRSLVELSAHVVAAVGDAVQATRDELEANRDAGVVDAGARGFEVFLQALHDHLSRAPERDDDAVPPVVERSGATEAAREAGSPAYRYEVQYLLDAPDDVAPRLRRALEQLGDSVVVVAVDGLVNVHVHTNRIGEAIEVGVEHGEPSRIAVTEFADGEAGDPQPAGPGDGAAATSVGPVAVLPGSGLAALAHRSGATVVDGRAGALPSVADLVAAVTEAPGDVVVILPGHPNAVPTARQAGAVTDGREVVVLTEADHPIAALAALAVCDGAGDASRVIEDMRAAAAACRCGEVVAAVRDAHTPVGEVRSGQWLAVVDHDVVERGDDPVEVLLAVAERLAADPVEMLTLAVGADVDGAERDRALAALERALPAEVELDVFDGGQRPARYLLGLE